MVLEVDSRLQLTSIQFLIQTLGFWILRGRKYEKMYMGVIVMVIHFMGQGLEEFFPKIFPKSDTFA